MGAILYPKPDRSGEMAKANNAFSDTEFKVPNFSQFYADYSRMMGDFGKLFGNSKTPFLDVDAVMATQRRNIEALTKANKLARSEERRVGNEWGSKCRSRWAP